MSDCDFNRVQRAVCQCVQGVGQRVAVCLKGGSEGQRQADWFESVHASSTTSKP